MVKRCCTKVVAELREDGMLPADGAVKETLQGRP
jgi:hypothetical protein